MRPSLAAVLCLTALAAVACTDEIGVTCPPGKLACNGVCVAIAQDADNCGGCGIQCAGEIVCISGQCACPKDQTNCSDVCIRTDRDHENCGACGNACDAAFVCSAGKCAGSCPSGQMECSGGCVNLLADDANCGGCDQPCGTGESCVDGSCALLCENNLAICGSACVDTNNDPAHCGSCDNPCNMGEFCASGMCVAGCPPSFLLCTDPMNPSGAKLCVDPKNDPNNCGGCAIDDVMPADPDMGTGPIVPHVCSSSEGANSQGVCANGKCAYICAESFAICGFSEGGPETKPGEPYCPINTAESNCNCGGCNIGCDGWFGGQFCSNEGFTQLCCDSMCQPKENFLSDTSCGSCGNVVACSGAASSCCQESTSFFGDIKGVCSTLTENRHCGACDNDCTGAFAIGLCCDNGDGGVDCTEGLAPENCGGCGNTCPVGNACCQGSGGAPPSCIDLDNDPQNCGGCGIDCASACAPNPAIGCGMGSAGVCDCDLPL